jgi:hypothetical protein
MGPPSVPAPQKPDDVPPPPDKSAQEIQDSAAKTRQRIYGSQGGLAQTMLTGGSGAPAPSTAVRFLGNVGK